MRIAGGALPPATIAEMREVLEVPAPGWAAGRATLAGVDRLGLLVAEMQHLSDSHALYAHDIGLLAGFDGGPR